MRLAGLLCISTLASGAALRLPPPHVGRRAALQSAAALTIVPLSASADESLSNAKARIQAAKEATEKNRAAYLVEAGLTEKAAPVAVDINAAERKLQQLVAESVEKKEKMLGFKFDEKDIAETETILRNKYCGKAGLFSSMEGGTCREDVILAAYCSKDVRFSSNGAACEEEEGLKRAPGIQNLFK